VARNEKSAKAAGRSRSSSGGGGPLGAARATAQVSRARMRSLVASFIFLSCATSTCSAEVREMWRPSCRKRSLIARCSSVSWFRRSSLDAPMAIPTRLLCDSARAATWGMRGTGGEPRVDDTKSDCRHNANRAALDLSRAVTFARLRIVAAAADERAAGVTVWKLHLGLRRPDVHGSAGAEHIL